MEYKFIENGNDKKIAYNKNFSDDLINALESARKERCFVTLSDGNMETGEAWGDLYDQKGILSLTRGRDYLFPILLTFKRGDYDEDLDIEIGESYDFLSEKSTSYISEYLDRNSLEIEDIIDCSGSLLSSTVAVRVGLDNTKVIYKHPNFKASANFLDYEIVEEELITTCETKSSLTNLATVKKKKEKKYHLVVENENHSRHNSLKELNEYLEAILEINLLNDNDKK